MTMSLSQTLSCFRSPTHNMARGGQHQLIDQSTIHPVEGQSGARQRHLCSVWEFCSVWLGPDTKGFHSFPCVLGHLHLAGNVHGPATPQSTCNKTTDTVLMGKLRQTAEEIVTAPW